MPPMKGPLWDYFLAGAKQNGSHIRAHCRGCLEKARPAGATVELDEDGEPKMSSEPWVVEGKHYSHYHKICTNLYATACKADIGGVLGVNESMIAHILGKNGNNPCPNASEDAQNMVKAQKKGKKKRGRETEGSDTDNGVEKDRQRENCLPASSRL